MKTKIGLKTVFQLCLVFSKNKFLGKENVKEHSKTKAAVLLS